MRKKASEKSQAQEGEKYSSNEAESTKWRVRRKKEEENRQRKQ